MRRRGQQPRPQLFLDATIITVISISGIVPVFAPPPAIAARHRPSIPSATTGASAAFPRSSSSQSPAAAAGGRGIAASRRRDQTVGRKCRARGAETAGNGAAGAVASSAAVRGARGGGSGGVGGGEARPGGERRVQQLPLQAFQDRWRDLSPETGFVDLTLKF